MSITLEVLCNVTLLCSNSGYRDISKWEHNLDRCLDVAICNSVFFRARFLSFRVQVTF